MRSDQDLSKSVPLQVVLLSVKQRNKIGVTVIAPPGILLTNTVREKLHEKM